MKELWKDVKDYEGIYQVSNLGRVKSLERLSLGKSGSLRKKVERILKCGKYRYETVVLCKNSTQTTNNIHRLVAESFIDNPENKRCVNHIDGNKHNNKVENLEWCTHGENTKHALMTGLHSQITMKGRLGKDNPNSKKVHMFSKDGTLIRTFYGVNEAARCLNKKTSTIASAARGDSPSAYGFKWKYA